LAAVALWYRQKQLPIPDFYLIFSVGALAPFLILCQFLLIFPSEDAKEIVSNTNLTGIALAFVYVISGTTIWVTLQLKNKPTTTLRGALGLLSTLLMLLALLRFDLFLGRIAILLVALLGLIWGRKQFRAHFWVHASVGFLIITFGLSFFLLAQGSLPIWVNLIGYTLFSIVLVIWAYQSGS
jgi:hypothetical protein